MDLTDIRKLVRLMVRAELTELEIDDTKKGLKVRLARQGEAPLGSGQQPMVQFLPSAAPAGVAGGSAGAVGDGGVVAGPPPGTITFESPMVGTFYRSSSPDSNPFVEPGTKVTEESVLCIIEAMKVMNEIKAELKGEIVEILVENGEPVEFGQPLFYVKQG
ncbi:MAG: acetyl-CoA carboxylase biotin carboxyl carrier protein [Planctomycetota bacterium]